jgi:hypothetical protein
MNTTKVYALLIDDLAAHWTESALAILKDAGLGPISVETELETWRSLRKELHKEVRWQRSFRVSTLVSLRTLREQVLRSAAMAIAEKSDSNVLTYDVESRIRSAAADVRSTDAERLLYSTLVELPLLHSAFKGPTRTDYTPRLRVSTVAG